MFVWGLSSWAGAASTAQINLSGSVSSNFDISVLHVGAASNLDIVNGETATQVATVTELTNNPSGYKVTIQSQNGGNLVHESATSSLVDYTLKQSSLNFQTGPISSGQVRDNPFKILLRFLNSKILCPKLSAYL